MSQEINDFLNGYIKFCRGPSSISIFHWSASKLGKDNIIISDVDGCLLDWESHFHDYMKSQGHERAYGVARASSYWKELEYPGLSQIEARRAVYQFNTSAWMLGLPPHLDAVAGIRRLSDAGYRFVVITAMGTDPYAKQAREINLERLFGSDVFEDIITTDLYDTDSKRKPLEKYAQTHRPWIEDKWSNAIMGCELGYRCFLMNHGYNQEHHSAHITRTDNWNDLCELLIG